ncbi:hypothetical protein ANANG_G00148240, partial [Anguilla anguilla]
GWCSHADGCSQGDGCSHADGCSQADGCPHALFCVAVHIVLVLFLTEGEIWPSCASLFGPEMTSTKLTSSSRHALPLLPFTGCVNLYMWCESALYMCFMRKKQKSFFINYYICELLNPSLVHQQICPDLIF